MKNMGKKREKKNSNSIIMEFEEHFPNEMQLFIETENASIGNLSNIYICGCVHVYLG